MDSELIETLGGLAGQTRARNYITSEFNARMISRLGSRYLLWTSWKPSNESTGAYVLPSSSPSLPHPHQITLIWSMNWNWVKCLYAMCKPLAMAIAVLMAISIAASEALLFLRVWAFALRSRGVMVFLTLFLVTMITGSVTCSIAFSQTLRFIPSPVPSITGVCLAIEAKLKYIIACFALIFAEQFVVMITCIIVGMRRHHHGWGVKSPLVRTLFIDGVVYFVVLSALALTNVILFSTPNTREFSTATIQGVLHSLLATRMLLNLRQLGLEGPDSTTAGRSLPKVSHAIKFLSIRTMSSRDRTGKGNNMRTML
ncbi:hypothetical protein CC1G_08305 [Coprinopsis cinerea okayama7|uniref:Uncharacterized protein n=1 Tax=Coprinopsis cinerea (strain Okayama-7 / 130 / ATCC MYA-4618 / FGSC 9003) TaxID=240176 RepID=A8PG71_COPC7|nr:hypothetical protein CC1G_08305 [Coprinopsis cinerea okayama7\|eukprot:XP_001841161.2 hypothetical protein CC1G_08305 [Coprinopsis cinerea okayama7\